MTNASELASELCSERDTIARLSGNCSGVETMHAYADLTDALVSEIVESAVESTEETLKTAESHVRSRLAVVAVGGYGRREMSPYSDVDVAFVVDRDDDVEVDLVVKHSFRTLMDVLDKAGLKVGYSYRKTDELEDLPLDTLTALVDARCIVGSPVVFSSFRSAARKALVPAAFVLGHVQGREGLGGVQATVFSVEPDLKEGRGGLRDLHTVRWLAQAAFEISYDDVWYGLRSKGILVDRDVEEMQDAFEFMSRSRNTLHLVAGHGLNILSVERQEEVAQKIGLYSAGDHLCDSFMKDYYSHAQKISRVLRKVCIVCKEQALEIEPGIVAQDGRLRILDSGLLSRDHGALIRIFSHARQYGLEISSDLLICAENVQRSESVDRSFLPILENSGAGATIRSMAELGVIQQIVPSFGNLMYLVPRDAAHQFTVGEHSLRTAEQLDLMFSGSDERVRDVCSGIENYDVLYLAALLHDIGKLDSKGDHARTGAPRARKIAISLGMTEDKAGCVEFLVRQHLRMSETARLRDLRQKKTVKDFVSVIRNPEVLDMLLLLTIADARSVGSSVWSQVQIRFLLELYERAYAAIRYPTSEPTNIDRHRRRVRRELCLASLPPDEVEEHCASMPASYLLNTSPNQLAVHIGYVRSVREGIPVVDLRDDRVGRFTELTVVSEDKPALLSRIAAVLYALGIDVHAAQIYTRHTADDIAIDTLFIDYQGHQLSEMRKRQVEGELGSVLRGDTSVEELLNRWRKLDSPRPEILGYRVLENLSDHFTVIEVRAEDTPGLLRYLTARFLDLGLEIHSARVATWGREARDAFYVTGMGARKLDVEEVGRLAHVLSTGRE